MSTQNQVIVTYDKYHPYENIPDSETLGMLPVQEAQSLLDNITNVAQCDQERCIKMMSIKYTQHLNMHFPTPHKTNDEYKYFGLSNIMLNGKSWCTQTNWSNPTKAGIKCIKNLRTGKCKCPVMRTIGAVLYPEFYAKEK